MKIRRAGMIAGILCAALLFGYSGLALHTAYAAEASEAAAEGNKFTTENGVLAIDLPSADWKEIMDPSSWVVLSNGVDMITIDHFANGEKLPDITVADSHYTNVYEAAVSTQNEVFLITGYVANEDSVQGVCSAIMSAEVLKHNTKQAVKKNSAVDVKQFAIREINKTYYVNADCVNVRSGCAVSEPIIGGLNKGNAVNVRGEVQYNGADYGWYQIDFNKGIGYVAKDFLSEKAPADAETTDLVYTGNVVTIYVEDGSPLTLSEATDGYWYDKFGTKYVEVGDGSYFNVVGSDQSYSIYNPANNSGYTGASVTVHDQYGYAYTLYEMADGSWWDTYGNQYGRGDGKYFVGPGNQPYTADGSIFDPDMAAGTDAGGYAGSNYEEFEGGYAGSNYEELEGGYASSSYEEFDGGYAGMNYEEFDN